MNNVHFGLSGHLIAEAVRNGETVCGPVFARNLWGENGLINIADYPICQLFATAIKGVNNTPTSEDLAATSNTYDIPSSSSTMTRTAGSRNFTLSDEGKMVRFTNGQLFYINTFVDATHVTVDRPASSHINNLKILLFDRNTTVNVEEIGRTTVYSVVPGENGTTTAGGVRTFTRTFVFDAEDEEKEIVPAFSTFSQTGTTVTRTAGGARRLDTPDIGKTIHFDGTGNTAVITAIIDDYHATVDVSQENPAGTIYLTSQGLMENPAPANYSWAGTTVTRTSGTRNFTTDDVGKIIYFRTSNVQAKITAFTDATHVTVNASAVATSQHVYLYGFRDYWEIAFSHSEEKDLNNINIRVVLATPIRAYRSTPLQASDQVKVTYQCKLTVSPITPQAQNLSTIITDPTSSMSGNKSGSGVIETFATSTVLANGDTDVSLADLEPYYAGSIGLSLDTDALAPLTGKVRGKSLDTTGLTPSGAVILDATTYNYSQVYTGTFALNEAVNTGWRSLMVVDPDSQLAAYTFLYAAAQKKDGEHIFTVSIRKTWGRDLS